MCSSSINSTADPRDFDAVFAASGEPELWNAESGRRWSVASRSDNGSSAALRILALEPYGSTFVVFGSGARKSSAPKSFGTSR